VGTFDDVLTANAAYAEQFTDLGLPGRAACGLAVVTCMDSRISPLEMLVPHQATLALLMVSALATMSRSRGWVAACRFRQPM